MKLYGPTITAPGRYSPAECIGSKKVRREGNPDIDHVSTSHVERMNLSIRMQNRRFTRLTNAFSKKLDNHIHALALYFAFYNFCRIHKSLRVTPAMAANITDRLWSLEDIIAKIDKMAPPPRSVGLIRRGRLREGFATWKFGAKICLEILLSVLVALAPSLLFAAILVFLIEIFSGLGSSATGLSSPVYGWFCFSPLPVGVLTKPNSN